jgi:predicted enzyme related to lactoylglutathione lyase
VARVNGLGGVFLRADDADGLRRWYADVLGVVDPPDGVWHQQAGPTVFAAFTRDSDHFPGDQQVMLNFRVDDLDALLRHLRDTGIAVLREEDQDGVGRFAWITDPEGNRVELWQPEPGT